MQQCEYSGHGPSDSDMHARARRFMCDVYGQYRQLLLPKRDGEENRRVPSSGQNILHLCVWTLYDFEYQFEIQQ